MNEFDDRTREDTKLREMEERLRAELVRVDAPPGFAERVLLQAMETSRKKHAGRRWAAVYGAIAAALLLCVFAGERMHQVHQERRRTLAQQQFETAMRVTDRTLEHTREQLARAGIQLGDGNKED